jgi:hypothetical protein
LRFILVALPLLAALTAIVPQLLKEDSPPLPVGTFLIISRDIQHIERERS